MPINNRMLVWPCLTLRCRWQYIMLTGLSRITNDFTDSWIDWSLKSVVHDLFHIMSSASQPPFVHSLIRLAARKKTSLLYPKHVPTGHWFLIVNKYMLMLIFQNFRLGMSLALGSDIYKHRLAERSPRNTHTLQYGNECSTIGGPYKFYRGFQVGHV